MSDGHGRTPGTDRDAPFQVARPAGTGVPQSGIQLQHQARKEQQTQVMKEEIDMLRDQLDKLRPDLGRQNSLFSSGCSVAIACILQLAAFAVSGIDWRTPTWGTATTFLILAVSIIVAAYAKICKTDSKDTFAGQKDSMRKILDRIFPETTVGAAAPDDTPTLTPATHWWQRFFRKLAGIK